MKIHTYPQLTTSISHSECTQLPRKITAERREQDRESMINIQHTHTYIQALFCCPRTSALNFPSRKHSRPLSRFPTRFPNAFPTDERVKIVALVLCQSVNQFRYIRNEINIHVNWFAFDFIDCGWFCLWFTRCLNGDSNLLELSLKLIALM